MRTNVPHKGLIAPAAWAAMLLGLLTLSSCTLPSAPPVQTYVGPTPGRPADLGEPSTQPSADGSTQPAFDTSTQPASQPFTDLGAPATAATPSAPASAPATGSTPSQPAVGPLRLTVDQAILMSLENNPSLGLQRFEPLIARTFEQEQRAQFDPLLGAQGAYSRDRAPGALDTDRRTTRDDVLLDANLSQRLPTGTDVRAGLTNELTRPDLRDDRYVTRAGLSVNQALLRGAGLDVNLAAVRQARLDTLASEYELRGVAEALVEQTERTYWNYALAQRTIEIVTNAMELADRQVQETRERVTVGSMAPTELAAAEAELARRRENLINARSLLATTRLELLRLLNPQRADFWDAGLELASMPHVPQVQMDDVQTYVDVAMRLRPELNQARLLIQRDQLELVRTRNGLLPQMDVFLTLGKSGYADSFGRSYGDIGEDAYDLLAGVRVEYPPGNRAARAAHQRATYTYRQEQLALENLSQLAVVDVRSAYIEVGRSLEQISATAATRRLQEQTLASETEKFRVGRSTNLLVAQAQRDLLESQISEVRAVVAYLNALTQLHLQEGALLERRGISAPGAMPIDLGDRFAR